MATPTPAPKTPSQSLTDTNTSAGSSSPLRCFTGSLISGALAFALYTLTSSIAQTFANKPIPSGKVFTVNIALAVRTLVVGTSTMATAIFAIATLGLLALGIQQIVQGFKAPQTEDGGDR